MSEPEDRDEAMDMLDEKRRGLRADAAQLGTTWVNMERENASLRLLVQQLRDPSCPIVYGQRVTWVEFKAISEDGP
jgi:hypothetical protein